MACEGCTSTHYGAVVKFYENEENAIEFLRQHGVLISSFKCLNCNSDCTYSHAHYRWTCYSMVSENKKKKKLCGFEICGRAGTFLQETHLPARKVVLFANCFLRKSYKIEDVMEDIHLGSKAAVDSSSFCSEVCMKWFKNQPRLT